MCVVAMFVVSAACADMNVHMCAFAWVCGMSMCACIFLCASQ